MYFSLIVNAQFSLIKATEFLLLSDQMMHYRFFFFFFQSVKFHQYQRSSVATKKQNLKKKFILELEDYVRLCRYMVHYTRSLHHGHSFSLLEYSRLFKIVKVLHPPASCGFPSLLPK